eukprot:2285878-Prorocentrum_lima.AAC.1
MTSSLVGSEMCIRDSPSRSHDRAAKEPQLKSNGCHRRRLKSPGLWSRSCLLYTSDAADDM